jgi:N-acetylglucosamine-1-phosphate uridyltransferase (contains nucleotidyltransferase and I-patch acetyltransferase domains)
MMLIFPGPFDLLTIENDVAIQSGAYIETISWSGQHLRVAPVHLQRGCKIGMRASVNSATVGHGSWITPFTADISDRGFAGDLGRSSGAPQWPLH